MEGILNDPIDVQKGMGLDGNGYTGYLGEFEGKIIEIRIAEQNSKPGKNGVSKVKAGELSTVVRLNENNLKSTGRISKLKTEVLCKLPKLVIKQGYVMKSRSVSPEHRFKL